MYAVSEDYLNSMHEAVQEGNLYGYIGDAAFTGEDILAGSCQISNQCADSSDLRLGSVYVGALNVTFVNKTLVPRGNWEGLVIRIFWNQRVDYRPEYERYEQIPCGVYVVAEANHTADGVVVTAYDYMMKFDKRTRFTTLTPSRPYDLLLKIATDCGVTLGMSRTEVEDLPNGLEIFNYYQDSDVETYRDLLSWVAQMLGGFATIDREGRLVIRYFGKDPVFTFSETERFQGCYFSDFVTFYGALSYVNVYQQAVIVKEIAPDGLTMALGANPFLQNGLAPYINFLLNNIADGIEDFNFTPFRTTTLGNPAFDLGDVIEFTGLSAGARSVGCIMSYTYTFGHSFECEGFGKNPATQGAQSRTDKNIAGLSKQSASNENVFLFLTNAAELGTGAYIADFQNGELFLGELLVGATKDTNIEVMTRTTYAVDFAVANDPPEFGAFRVWLRYELDGEVIKRVPFWRPLGLISQTYDTYEDTIVDYQPVLNLSGGDRKRLSVYFEYQYTGPTSSGEIIIDPNGFELTIKGQGIAATREWDGLITASDRVGAYEIESLWVKSLTDAAAVRLVPFIPVRVSDIIPGVPLGYPVPGTYDEQMFLRVSGPSSNVITEDGAENLIDETGTYNIVTE